MADQSSDLEIFTAGYEYIGVYVHIPILDLPDPPPKKPTAGLSRAVIQGSIDPSRRDYQKILVELENSLAGKFSPPSSFLQSSNEEQTNDYRGR